MNLYVIIKQAGLHCQWCEAAEMLLRKTNRWFRIDALPGETLREVAAVHAMKTVPIILVNDVLIGGHEDLLNHLKSEGLLPDDHVI